MFYLNWTETEAKVYYYYTEMCSTPIWLLWYETSPIQSFFYLFWFYLKWDSPSVFFQFSFLNKKRDFFVIVLRSHLLTKKIFFRKSFFCSVFDQVEKKLNSILDSHWSSIIQFSIFIGRPKYGRKIDLLLPSPVSK